MGLDVSVYLIVGVPMLELGKIQEEHETKELTDHFGERTGEEVTVRKVFFQTPNQKRFLIGSNERAIKDKWARKDKIEYFYCQDEDWTTIDNESWWQASDDGNPDQVVIGLTLKADKEIEKGRWEYYKATSITELNNAIEKVKIELEKHFGYSGKIYVISQASYGY